MRRSTSSVRRACALGTTAALVVLTTGLGIVTATAAHADGATVEPTPAASTAAPADGSSTSDPTVVETPSGASTATPTPSPTAEPSSDATTPAPSGSAPTGSTSPATPTGKSAPTDVQVAAADPTVTITGDAEVGSTLTATWTGFDGDGSFKYVWTDKDSGAVIAKTLVYVVDAAEAGKQVVVSVEGDRADGTGRATATSDPSAVITQDPVFVDADGTPIEGGTEADEDTLSLDDATAGEAYSYTFRAQGYPAPTYQLAWYYGTEEDTIGTVGTASEFGFGFGSDANPDTNGDGRITPDDQLPKGITFDPATGELSGTATEASYYDFAVTATSGEVSTTQYVELNVDPGAAYGLAAVALDKGLVDDRKGAYYIIRPDGSVVGLDLNISADDSVDEGDVQVLDHVSVKQGGTLLVYGTPVDRFGNDAVPQDGSDVVQATVTSNVASDVIAPYTENGAAGEGVSSVTFPHASTHTLTVAAATLQPVSFDVEVIPTVAPAVAVTPTGSGAQLAYTGTDATGALPWALGLVLAGAGLIGARTLRRRRAQR